MTPTEFLIQHRESIMGIYTVPSSTWNKVKFELPEIETIMTYNTFKTLIRPVVETCRFLSNELTSTKQELDKVTQERDNLQNMYNQLYNNDRLDKVIQNPDGLQKLDKVIQNPDGLQKLDKVIQNPDSLQKLDKVIQNPDGLQKLDKVIQNPDGLQKLDKVIQNPDGLQKLDKVIQSDKNIQGWSIQVSKGYYRGFRKFGRKLVSVYLGKNLDGAENKIIEKEQRIREAVTTTITHSL